MSDHCHGSRSGHPSSNRRSEAHDSSRCHSSQDGGLPTPTRPSVSNRVDASVSGRPVLVPRSGEEIVLHIVLHAEPIPRSANIPRPANVPRPAIVPGPATIPRPATVPNSGTAGIVPRAGTVPNSGTTGPALIQIVVPAQTAIRVSLPGATVSSPPRAEVPVRSGTVAPPRTGAQISNRPTSPLDRSGTSAPATPKSGRRVRFNLWGRREN